MPTDIRLDIGFWAHPKTVKLERRLGLAGVKALLVLWTWVAQNRPSGRLDGLSVEDLEISAGWSGEEGQFVSALTTLHWLDLDDGVCSAHGWSEHQPWIVGSEARKLKATRAATARWGNAPSIPGAFSENAPSIPGAMPLSLPIHSPENIPPTPRPESSGNMSLGEAGAPDAKPAPRAKAKPDAKGPRPAGCTPKSWARYETISRGFHKAKAQELGNQAPFSEAKVIDGARALDALIRVRNYPENEVVATLGWSTEDPFWRVNLRSIRALLKTSASNGELKYSNVLAAMVRDLEHRRAQGAANG